MKMRALITFVVVFAGCASNGDLRLLGSEDDEAEREERRRMLDLRVIEAGVSKDEPWPYTTLLSRIDQDCKATLAPAGAPLNFCNTGNPPVLFDNGSPQTNCDAQFCQTHLRLCRANRLLELAGTVRNVVLASTPAWTIPPQSTASNAGLAELAVTEARTALRFSGRALRKVSGRTDSSVCAVSHFNTAFSTGTRGESMGASFAEAYDLLWEAGERAAKQNVAVAEASFSQYSSYAKAARLSWTGNTLSFAHAAGILGGARSDGSLATLSGGVCNRPPLSGAAAVARDALRLSGISPTDLGGSATIDTILVGSPASANVRDRLAEIFDDSSFGALPTAAGVATAFGITPADFVEAREWLVAENRAFGRSSTLLEPRRLVGGGTTTKPVYASTAVSPTRPAPGMFLELIRRAEQSEPPTDIGTQTGEGPYMPIEDAYTGRGVVQSIDYAASVAYDLVNVDSANLNDRTKDILGNLAALGRRTRPARLEVCHRKSASSTWQTRLRVLADPPAAATSEYLLVTSRDGLECATRGNVDGDRCDLSMLDVDVTPTLVNTPDSQSGFPRYVEWFITVGTQPATTTYYALRLRPGAPANRPGSYEHVAAAWVPAATSVTTPWKWCTLVPSVPHLDRVAEEAVTPHADHCTMPATSCAGLPFDQKIPLEDELTDDGDPFESSWRHYVTLARQAADEADLLGEQLIAQGLEMDARAEEALDELETICGATVNADGLFPVSTSTACGTCPSGQRCDSGLCVPDVVDVACVSGSCSMMGYSCIGNRCVRDPLEIAVDEAPGASDRNRLLECLGESTVNSFVTAGSRPVCIFHISGDSTRVCEGSTHECPYLKNPTTGMCDPVSGVTVVEVNTTLDLFAEEAAAHRNEGLDPPCDAIRWIRWATGTFYQEPHRQLRDSGFFDPATLGEMARGIEYEARIGDFSNVTFGGRIWVSTGDIRHAALTPTPEWPCNGLTYVPAPNCVDRSGLFCSTLDCNNVTARATFNDRLARAVIAARVLTGSSLNGVKLPVVFRSSAGAVFGSYQETTVAGALWRRGVSSSIPTAGGTVTEPMNMSCLTAGTGWTQINFTPPGYTPVSHLTRCITPTIADLPFVVAEPRQPAPSIASGVASELWGGLGVRDITRAHMGPKVYEALYADNEQALSIAFTDPRLRDLTTFWSEIDPSGILPPDRINLAQIAWEGLRHQDIADAAELICEAAAQRQPPCNVANPPEVTSAADLPDAEAYIRCVAAHIERGAARMVFANMPQRAVDALRRSASTAYPALGGETGERVAALRASIIEVANLGSQIGATTRLVANDMEQIRLALARLEVDREIATVRLQSTISNQLAACIASASPGVGGEGLSFNTGSAATCANSVAQIAFAFQESALAEEGLSVDAQRQLADFEEQFVNRVTTLGDLATQIAAASEGIDGALAGLESARRRGQRALARASFADSDGAGRHYNVNTSMRRRYNTLRIRYEQAHQHAIRMSFLAKRAIEQRLGMRLADLREDMSLVEAPSSWEAKLCTSTGIDYARIRDFTALTTDNYADAYIGDYVDKLERVVESYRLDYPFGSADDTAVISLRDEVLNVRAVCDVPVENMLYYSGTLDQLAESDGTRGWAATSCADPTVNCTTAVPLEDRAPPPATGLVSPVPFDPSHPDVGETAAYRVYFGKWSATGTNGHQLSTHYAQRLDLRPGRYRVSWFARQTNFTGTTYVGQWSGSILLPKYAILAAKATGGTLLDVGTVVASTAASGWDRYFGIFDLTTAEQVLIGPHPTSTSNQAVDVAAIMLENVTGLVPDGYTSAEDYPPREYADTADSLTRPLAVCEDTTGEVFRATGGWHRECVQLCSDGFAADCTEESARTYCYWEVPFSITQSDIEFGRTVRSGGFARGNYNYRVDSIALNFVGSATRSCTDDRLPSTCYSAAYVPYSIEHLGPYAVRNHRGEDYEAPLFTGRIEHGRGLAAERYITNPISSADRALIEPYLHRELRGRPLDGRYLLRVWEEDGVNFDGIEDVQIVLNYRYWTRFD